MDVNPEKRLILFNERDLSFIALPADMPNPVSMGRIQEVIDVVMEANIGAIDMDIAQYPLGAARNAAEQRQRAATYATEQMLRALAPYAVSKIGDEAEAYLNGL